MVMRFVHEPEDIRAANRAHAERAAQEHGLARASSLMCVGLCALQYVLEEGQRERLVRLARSSSALLTVLASSLVAPSSSAS